LMRKIAPNEKAGRLEILRKLGRDKKRRHLRSFVGKRLDVLFENRDYKDSDYMTGLSENYLRVKAPLAPEYKGQIMAVIPEVVMGDFLLSNSSIENNN